MFFIFGISNGEKKLNFVQTMVCTRCGQFGRLEVFMTYQYFSLFFIPIFRWGLRFYAKSSCCGSVYQLDTPLGKRILRGEQVSLSEEDMTVVNTGWSQARQDYGRYGEAAKSCNNCGYIADPDFVYCPKCGKLL